MIDSNSKFRYWTIIIIIHVIFWEGLPKKGLDLFFPVDYASTRGFFFFGLVIFVGSCKVSSFYNNLKYKQGCIQHIVILTTNSVPESTDYHDSAIYDLVVFITLCSHGKFILSVNVNIHFSVTTRFCNRTLPPQASQITDDRSQHTYLLSLCVLAVYTKG